jgi:hypothetical protein
LVALCGELRYACLRLRQRRLGANDVRYATLVDTTTHNSNYDMTDTALHTTQGDWET